MSRAKRVCYTYFSLGRYSLGFLVTSMSNLSSGFDAPTCIDLRLPASNFLILPNLQRIFIVSGCPKTGHEKLVA